MVASKKVAVVASRVDKAAELVAKAVQKAGGQALLVETERVPESLTMSWRPEAIAFDGMRLDSLRVFYIKAIYLGLPIVQPDRLNARNFELWQDQYVAEQQRQSFLYSILRDLHRQGRTFVNPVQTLDLHYLKLFQLSLLRRHGIPVPDTLATNDPAQVRAFAGKHGAIIYKPLAGGAAVSLLNEGDLTAERLQLLANCPILFQEQIQGDEFRAYVLNGEPVAAFQIPTTGVVDARAALDQCSPAELPAEIWETCIRGAELLDLVFTAVDLRRTQNGLYVTLEFNPTPAIAFFEDPTDGVVLRRLADFLVSRA